MLITSDEKKKLSKKITWISILLVILLSIVLSISVYIYFQIEPLVASRIKETIKTSTDGLYKISFSNITINPFNGNVILRDIVFKVDLATYKQFKQKGINPNHLYDIRVKSLKVYRVHPLKVYLNRDLVINSIQLENPSIHVYYEKIMRIDSAIINSRTTWQRLSKYLNSIKIGKVFFKEIDFKYIDNRLKKAEINSVKNLSITIDDILIDSLNHNDKTRFYHTKDILVEVFDNQFSSDDNMYTVKFDKLEMSTLNKYALVKGLRIIPKYPELEFSLKWKIKKARYQVDMNEAKLDGIDYKTLTDKRQLHASSLNISNANLEVFMNAQLPKPIGDLGKNFPQLMLKRLRLISTIDTLKIKNSSLSYSEYNPTTAKKGKIAFTALRGELLNITNDSLSLMKNNQAKGKFTAYAYGKGRLDFNINFNLTSPHQEYNYSGKLHKMQARYFNQITRPLALLDINSGLVQSATFNVKADYRKASGSLTLIYNDFNIGILKLNENKKLKKSTLLSLVANNLLLKEDNPTKAEPLRVGKIEFTRPDSVSFYSMIWKSFFTGIKESIGMTAERERSLQKQFEKFKSDNPRSKTERQLQREERRKKWLNKK
ncbi:MAG: hypothetical protein ACO1N7_07740 [Sphingobacteriaceae bacterium]